MNDVAHQRRGRRIVLAIAIGAVASSAIVIVTFLVVRGSERFSEQIVRFTLTVLLSLHLYWGYAWARWVAIALCLAAGVLGLVDLLDGRQITMAAIPVIALLAFYLASGLALLAHPSVRAHFGARIPHSA